MADNGQQADGDKWGDEISKERKAWLEQRLHAWEQEADHGQRKGPFDRTGLSDEERAALRLSGADVFWLAARSLARTDEAQALWEQSRRLRRAQRDAAIRFDINLQALRLAWADLRGANLSKAVLFRANLSGADLGEADLSEADLFRADLSKAGLGRADLSKAVLHAVSLSGTDLREARLTVETALTNAILSTETLLADVIWNNAPLARLAWEKLPVLGDEPLARKVRDNSGTKKDIATRVAEYEAAVRTYRLLAVTLRNQGLNEHADRFAYRAQICQRAVFWRQRKLGAYLFSAFLDALAGYGYKPARSVRAYLLVVLAFATAYFLLGPVVGVPFPPVGAVVFSMTSFHGRGFFPGGSPGHSITLDDPLTVVAACEALVGLAMEISFFATITNRFFSR